MADGTTRVDTVRDDTMTDDTMAEDSMAHDPMVEDTMADDTMANDTMASDTMASDTMAEDGCDKSVIDNSDTDTNCTTSPFLLSGLHSLYRFGAKSSKFDGSTQDSGSKLKDDTREDSRAFDVLGTPEFKSANLEDVVNNMTDFDDDTMSVVSSVLIPLAPCSDTKGIKDGLSRPLWFTSRSGTSWSGARKRSCDDSASDVTVDLSLDRKLPSLRHYQDDDVTVDLSQGSKYVSVCGSKDSQDNGVRNKDKCRDDHKEIKGYKTSNQVLEIPEASTLMDSQVSSSTRSDCQSEVLLSLRNSQNEGTLQPKSTKTSDATKARTPSKTSSQTPTKKHDHQMEMLQKLDEQMKKAEGLAKAAPLDTGKLEKLLQTLEPLLRYLNQNQNKERLALSKAISRDKFQDNKLGLKTTAGLLRERQMKLMLLFKRHMTLSAAVKQKQKITDDVIVLDDDNEKKNPNATEKKDTVAKLNSCRDVPSVASAGAKDKTTNQAVLEKNPRAIKTSADADATRIGDTSATKRPNKFQPPILAKHVDGQSQGNIAKITTKYDTPQSTSFSQVNETQICATTLTSCEYREQNVVDKQVSDSMHLQDLLPNMPPPGAKSQTNVTHINLTQPSHQVHNRQDESTNFSKSNQTTPLKQQEPYFSQSNRIINSQMTNLQGQPIRMMSPQGQPIRIVNSQGQPIRIAIAEGHPSSIINANTQPLSTIDSNSQPDRIENTDSGNVGIRRQQPILAQSQPVNMQSQPQFAPVTAMTLPMSSLLEPGNQWRPKPMTASGKRAPPSFVALSYATSTTSTESCGGSTKGFFKPKRPFSNQKVAARPRGPLPELKQMIDDGRLQPGENVLSQHTTKMTYFATLQVNGYIKANGKYFYKTPVAWCLSVPENKGLNIKKQTAYRRILYRGKQLLQCVSDRGMQPTAKQVPRNERGKQLQTPQHMPLGDMGMKQPASKSTPLKDWGLQQPTYGDMPFKSKATCGNMESMIRNVPRTPLPSTPPPPQPTYNFMDILNRGTVRILSKEEFVPSSSFMSKRFWETLQITDNDFLSQKLVDSIDVW